jgi:hypothetical protein
MSEGTKGRGHSLSSAGPPGSELNGTNNEESSDVNMEEDSGDDMVIN